MYSQGNNPFKKKMGDFKHSDAPDAKGKFKSMSSGSLASWLIKTRLESFGLLPKQNNLL